MRAKSLVVLLVVLSLLGAAGGTTLTVTHGPVVGGVTATSARVFVRTAVAETASIWLTPPSGPAIVVPFTTTAATDFTAIVTATGLAPSTHYAVTVPGTDAAGAFTSFPQPQSTEPVTIVYLTDFEGPTGAPKEPTPIFANAAAELPNFVMLGGDMDHRNPGAGFVKGTDPAIVTESYRAMWRGMYSVAPGTGLPSFAPNILARFPVVHMLDDHDWGANNANKNFRWGRVAAQVL